MKSFIDNKFVCVPYSSSWRNFFTQIIIVGDVCILQFSPCSSSSSTLKYSSEILMRSPSPSTYTCNPYHTSQRAINGVKNVLSWAILFFYLLILCKEFQFFWHLNVLGRGKVKDSCCLVYTCVASSQCSFKHLFSLSPSFTMRSVK